MLVPVGEKLVDYNEGFKLYLATRNSRIDLPPDASALLTQVNFHSSRAGLAGQLLSATIARERPELEVRQSELLKKQEEQKLELIQLEESLLVQLANAQGMRCLIVFLLLTCGIRIRILYTICRQHPGE